MKTMITPIAALLLIGCSSAMAQPFELLSPLEGSADNALIDQLKTRNPGSLCALVKDGTARLMSFGGQAVVDVGGTAAVLSYHPDRSIHEASFSGAGIRISGDLVRESVTDFGKTISKDVRVRVVAGRRTEELEANWTCQSSLPTLRVIH